MIFESLDYPLQKQSSKAFKWLQKNVNSIKGCSVIQNDIKGAFDIVIPEEFRKVNGDESELQTKWDALSKKLNNICINYYIQF